MLMYQKQPKRKKRRKHAPSILHQEPGLCYLCARLHGNYAPHRSLHKHHAYGGANRRISEENGFWVNLCWKHHTYGGEAVHENDKNMRLIQQDMQREYEKTHTRQQFMSLIGRNYLEEEENGEDR